MVKPYGVEYFVSILLIFASIAASIIFLRNKKQIYKNLLLNFLAYLMLFNNCFYVALKYNWSNSKLHTLFAILTIALSVLFSVVAYLLERFCKNTKVLSLYKTITAVGIIAVQIALMAAQINTSVNIYFFGHLCNQMAWLLALYILVFPKSKIINYVYYAALIGSVISFVYPATLKPTPSVLHFDFFRNVYGHGVLIWASLFLWLTGMFKPNLKNLWVLPVGLCVSYLYAHFTNEISANVFGKTSNYLFLNNFPVPYLNAYVSAILAVGGVYLFVYFYERFTLQKHNNANNKDEL